MKFQNICAYFLLFFLIGCASQKYIKKTPFNIHSSKYYENENIKAIYIRYSSKNYIDFDSLYFQGQKAKIRLKSIRGLSYIFTELKQESKSDLVLHQNPTKEANNQVPTSGKFNFNSLKNEAIISFYYRNKLTYYTISDIEKVNNLLQN